MGNPAKAARLGKAERAGVVVADLSLEMSRAVGQGEGHPLHVQPTADALPTPRIIDYHVQVIVLRLQPTVVGYLQLKARVARVFADTGIGGDTEAYFASKLPLLGGADFKTLYVTARTSLYTVRTEATDGSDTITYDARNHSLVLFDRGDEIVVNAGPDGIRFLLVSGRPLEEPVAWYGPIVMNTDAELRQAMADLRAGTFIKHP